MIGLVDEAWANPNKVPKANDSGVYYTNMGKTIGTDGEQIIKIVTNDNGGVITAYPVYKIGD